MRVQRLARRAFATDDVRTRARALAAAHALATRRPTDARAHANLGSVLLVDGVKRRAAPALVEARDAFERAAALDGRLHAARLGAALAQHALAELRDDGPGFREAAERFADIQRTPHLPLPLLVQALLMEARAWRALAENGVPGARQRMDAAREKAQGILPTLAPRELALALAPSTRGP